MLTPEPWGISHLRWTNTKTQRWRLNYSWTCITFRQINIVLSTKVNNMTRESWVSAKVTVTWHTRLKHNNTMHVNRFSNITFETRGATELLIIYASAPFAQPYLSFIFSSHDFRQWNKFNTNRDVILQKTYGVIMFNLIIRHGSHSDVMKQITFIFLEYL